MVLRPTTRKGHVIPSLKSGTLLSLRQLCDHDCHVFLHKFIIKMYKNDKIILEGDGNLTTGL